MRRRKLVRTIQRRWSTKVVLRGGPFDGETVRLSTNILNDVNTLPLAPLRGFPAGRYVNRQWEELP